MIKIASALGLAPKYDLDITDTIIEFNGKPLRTIKMRITGMEFPDRDAPVFVRIRHERQVEECWMAEIAEENRALYGFFPVDSLLRGDVEFGYADKVIAVFRKIRWERLQRLENEKVEREVINADQEWLKKMRASKKKGM